MTPPPGRRRRDQFLYDGVHGTHHSFQKCVLSACIALTAACSGKSEVPPNAAGDANMPYNLSAKNHVEARHRRRYRRRPNRHHAVARGWLYEAGATIIKGKQFDSSLTRHEPFKFPLNRLGDQGLGSGCRRHKGGESRRLIIPPELAYGDAGAGGVIPPGAT